MTLPRITRAALLAAGPDNWSSVPIAEIWMDELLPILQQSGPARRHWLRAMRHIARSRTFDPLVQSPYYRLSAGDGAVMEVDDAMEVSGEGDLYSSLLHVRQDCDTLSPATQRELSRIAADIWKRHCLPDTEARWYIPTGRCHTLVVAGLVLAEEWEPQTKWRVFYGQDEGCAHSVVVDLQGRRLFDLMLLDQEPCNLTAREVWDFCLQADGNVDAPRVPV